VKVHLTGEDVAALVEEEDAGEGSNWVQLSFLEEGGWDDALRKRRGSN